MLYHHPRNEKGEVIPEYAGEGGQSPKEIFCESVRWRLCASQEEAEALWGEREQVRILCERLNSANVPGEEIDRQAENLAGELRDQRARRGNGVLLETR